MTFCASAFNATEKAAGDRRRAELGPGWNTYDERTKRWEWVPEQMELSTCATIDLTSLDPSSLT